MEIYLVGGAVRDELLGLPIEERDWVVVGATPEEMIQQGFKPVGKDFPVFLHPKTHEEYALARSEKKIARGYQGFSFYTSPDISLVDDLKRRDITINAIAKDEAGQLIDPYHGVDDLKAKTFRHVSPAFLEDPVRILRLARLHAKLPDFSIAPDTLALMKNMVNEGEVDALVAERVWQEFHKALRLPKPSCFIETLASCGALQKIMPGLQLTPELKAIDQPNAPLVRFALLCHQQDAANITRLAQGLRCPKNYLITARLFAGLPVDTSPTAEHLLTLLGKLDAFRKPERVAQFSAYAKALIPTSQLPALLPEALTHAQLENIPELLQGVPQQAMPSTISAARLRKLKQWRS